MSLTTKAFAAQDALVNLMTPATGLADWSPEFGLPGKRKERHIWVDETVDDWTQEPYTTELTDRDEKFKLHVFIYSRLIGATAAQIRDEISAVGGQIETLIGSSPFLGSVVMSAWVAGGEYDSAFADAEGRAREGCLRLDIACEAVLG